MNEELKNILIKVGNLYVRYGIKSVTMDDVSRELGISKKTLYQHVVDKNDLVSKVVDMLIEDSKNSLDCLFNKELNAIEQLFEVHKHVMVKLKEYSPVSDYDLRKYYPDEYRKLHHIRREKMYDYMLCNLRKGKEEGLYRKELDEEILAKIHVSRIQNTFDSDLLTNEEKTSAKVFYEFFIYHIRGIASEYGIRLLEEKLEKKELQSSYNQ
ncbi:MAG: TetR/AcrR family transcriptional regulator [Bacteroidetes bacterium]|nr:TetR/AcrR family transcriptional regulator [Bacteroidota bacterium]